MVTLRALCEIEPLQEGGIMGIIANWRGNGTGKKKTSYGRKPRPPKVSTTIHGRKPPKTPPHKARS